MFYGECYKCGERWSLGEASTCTCPDLVTYHPNKREWVGLTEADIYDAMRFEDEWEMALATEAKLKEKNMINNHYLTSEEMDQTIEALEEAVYWLHPTEQDMQEKGGIYRIVIALEMLKEKNT